MSSYETISRLGQGDDSCRSTDEVHVRRRGALQTLFKGTFEEGDLSQALKEAEVEEAEKAVRKSEVFAKEWCPVQDKERIKMYSFVIAYTQQLNPQKKEENPFFVLNKAILDFEPSALTNVRQFLFCLLKALRSLPYMQYSNLYRGIDKKLGWECDDMRIFPTFTSTSRDPEGAKTFLGRDKEGKKSGTLITAKDLFGYDVSEYSPFEHEKEVILEPFQQVFVQKVEKEGEIVNIEVNDGGGSEFLIEGLIPRKFVVEKPESEMFQEALDHCRAGNLLKVSGKREEVRREWEEGMKHFLEIAEKGNGGEFSGIGERIGALNVGVGLLLGVGVEKDFEKGLDWLKKVGKVREEEVWMMRELSNREFFSKDRRIDMSGLLFSFGVNLI